MPECSTADRAHCTTTSSMTHMLTYTGQESLQAGSPTGESFAACVTPRRTRSRCGKGFVLSPRPNGDPVPQRRCGVLVTPTKNVQGQPSFLMAGVTRRAKREQRGGPPRRRTPPPARQSSPPGARHRRCKAGDRPTAGGQSAKATTEDRPRRRSSSLPRREAEVHPHQASVRTAEVGPPDRQPRYGGSPAESKQKSAKIVIANRQPRVQAEARTCWRAIKDSRPDVARPRSRAMTGV